MMSENPDVATNDDDGYLITIATPKHDGKIQAWFKFMEDIENDNFFEIINHSDAKRILTQKSNFKIDPANT